MSKIALSGNASGTGVLSIVAPNTNSDRTLTLPDNSGTVLTSASNLAGVTGVGKVLQVVQATVSSSITTTSTSYVTTGLASSITPSSSSSKILIFVNGGGQYLDGGGTANLQITVYRNATNLGGGTQTSLSRLFGANQLAVPNSIALLDSPSTTSSTTYTVYFKSVTGGSVWFNVGGDSGLVAITLMEIAA